MILKLNNEMSRLLLEEVEDVQPLIISQKAIVSDIKELQLLINDEIVYRGLDNQETVNDFGKKLYDLYDAILYQKHSN